MSRWDKFIAWCQRDDTWFWPALFADIYLALESDWAEWRWKRERRKRIISECEVKNETTLLHD